MNKKNNRKGFTTVELVIVITVIAILATVLIPTFSNLITKANQSSAMQQANGIYKNLLIEHADNLANFDGYIAVDGYYFVVEDGQFSDTALTTAPTDKGNLLNPVVEDPS